MRIQFKTEGGVAHFPGLSRPLELDTAQLAPSEADALSSKVAEARLLEPGIAARLATDKGGADRRSYSLVIEEGESRCAVVVAEPIEDPAVERLVQELRRLQRERAGG